MDIYVIEDKAEELENARSAIEGAGHKCANGKLSAIQMFNAGIGKEHGNRGQLAQLEPLQAVEWMRDCGGGIITDMMFNLIPQNGDVPTSGILVVLHALSRGVPVVVCTDAEEVGGHHAKALSWIHDAYIMPAKKCGILPFGWVETKSWQAAVRLLVEQNYV